jgi:hypothetical protein
MPGGYIVRDVNGQALAYIYSRDDGTEALQAKISCANLPLIRFRITGRDAKYRASWRIRPYNVPVIVSPIEDDEGTLNRRCSSTACSLPARSRDWRESGIYSYLAN